jgi:glycosyltransferase involved in cell wall biosynthesis
MRIGFDATNIFGHGGIKTYARELIRALSSEYPDDELVLLTTPSSSRRKKLRRLFAGQSSVIIRGILPHVSMLGAALSPLTRTASSIMWRMTCGSLDLIHLTDPFGTASLPPRFVATIHDLFPLSRQEYEGSALAGYYAGRTPDILSRAHAVITPSNYVAGQIRGLYPDADTDIIPVPEAASEAFHPMKADSGISIHEGSYFLYVGRPDVRKNLPVLLEAFGRYSEETGGGARLLLVTSGLSGNEPGPVPEGMAEDGTVVLLNDLSKEELRSAYCGALALVFPSLDEGFGLPVVEAMQCGCPVITSRCSCLPEISGNAALLVDPEDPAELAEAMISVAGSTQLQKEMSEKGICRASEYSWSRTARETMSVYRRVAE